MSHAYAAVMFDLDGTLADTLAPIAAAGNHMLSRLGQAPLPVDRYRYLAGQGLESLIHHALPEALRHRADEAKPIYRDYYTQHGLAMTRPYAGVPELLAELVRMNRPLAVLSNKPHDAVIECLTGIFPAVAFAAVLGVTPGSPIKPDPAGAMSITRELNIAPDRWVYVGDTAADMRTGRAAGMFTVGVTWGFREEKELRENGAQAIVHEPMAIAGIVAGTTHIVK